MGMVYLVRRKKFRILGEVKELYYAVQRKFQVKGGKTEEDLANILASRGGRSRGDVLGILTDLPDVIEGLLAGGESVTIKGFGSFQTAISSNGFEVPEDVTPGEVRLSKIYFIPDRKLVARVGRRMKFFRYPLSKYFPKELLRSDTVERESEEADKSAD